MKFVGAHIFSYDATFRGDVTIEGNLTVSNSVSQTISFGDNDILYFGNDNDLQIKHSGSEAIITNNTGQLTFVQNVNDNDIVFKSDDGSGGTTAYITLDGSDTSVVFNKSTKFGDGVGIFLGTGNDLSLSHNGTDSNIVNWTGNLNITNNTDDGDIIFKSDDGSGGVTEYFRLDGGDANGTLTYTKWADNSIVTLGASKDLRIYHNGTNSIIQNYTGNLKIRNGTNDGDIVFDCDDGSGGLETYFYLDGSASAGSPFTVFPDSSNLAIGTGFDLRLKHDGSNSYIQQVGIGDLYIQQGVNDKDIIFQCDDGSGGTTPYLTLDGSATELVASKNLRFDYDNSNIKFGGNNTFVGELSNSNKLQLRGGGSNTAATVYIDSSGNMGLGTSAPSSKLDVRGTVQVGIDDTGYDVKFFGATSGRYMLWDESDDSLQLPDNTVIKIGTGLDLKLKHDGTDSYIDNTTGDFKIRNFSDDKDIFFQNDDGSGGVTTYFYLDGSIVENRFAKATRHSDSIIAKFGDGNDMNIYSDGTNGIISVETNDADLKLMCDDGSGGVTSYITLDGGDTDIKVHKNFEIEKTLTMQHTADPSDPATGHSVMWSDTSGNLKVKINVGGSVVTRTLATGTD